MGNIEINPKTQTGFIPKVSIGLPVYNGERYLAEAIDSILNQTFTDFELIISDNASTDRTEDICQDYASKDARIHYSRNATNIGGANNHNRTFMLSNGDYFRFAAYDDIFTPQLLSRSVDILDKNPAVVLCYSVTRNIDEYGNSVKDIDLSKATSTRPIERFRDLTGWDYDCEPSYGLIRSNILRKTGLLKNYTDADRTLLCELSLYGQFFQIPEPLFYRRIHPAKSTAVYSDWRQRMAWFYPNSPDRVSFPHWMQFFHYLGIIGAARISRKERIYCYMHLVHWLFMEKRWGKMVKDLMYAGIKFFRLATQRIDYGKNFPSHGSSAS